MRPDIALGAESSAGVRSDDAHVCRLDAQRQPEDERQVGRALHRVPDQQLVTLPPCCRGGGLHRIVMATRLSVVGLDLVRRRREAGREIAPGDRFTEPRLARRFHQRALAGHDRRRRIDEHLHGSHAGLGGLQRLRDDDGDGLILIFDHIGLQRQAQHGGRRLDSAEIGHVGACEHAHDAGQPQSCCAVHLAQAAAGDR